MTEQSTAIDTTHAVADAIEHLEGLAGASLSEQDEHTLHVLSSLCSQWELAIGNELVRRHEAARQRHG